MAHHMTSTIRKMVDEYINDIPDKDLERFVRFKAIQTGPVSNTYHFGSDDFQLVFSGGSDAEPTYGKFMVELRANKASKDGALRALALNSTKFNGNQRRFALIMYSPHAMTWLGAQHVRMALKASPVWKEGVINKVLVDYDPLVRFYPHPDTKVIVPFLPNDMLPSELYTYTPVPFDGFNVDGTEISKKSGKQEKKGAAAGKK